MRNAEVQPPGPEECRKKAEALAMLAAMFPDKAGAYRAAEQRWLDLETKAMQADNRRR
jgi:hypothetical protein